MRNFSKDIRKYGNTIACKELKNGSIFETNFFELAQKIDQATLFIHKEHGERNHIALLGENSSTWISLCIGIYASNNVAVSLDSSKEDQVLFDLINFADISALYISEKQAKARPSLIENLGNVKVLIMEESMIQAQIAHSGSEKEIGILQQEHPIDQNNLAHIMFTSGTTSEPKGVMHSYSSLSAAFRKKNPDSATTEKVVFSIAPYHHIYGLVTNVLGFLHEGRTICIVEKTEDFLPSISVFEPEYITIVPAILSKLALVFKKQGFGKFFSIVGKNLKSIGVGGANASPDDFKTLLAAGITFHTGYGSTETASTVLRNTITPLQENKDQAIGTLGNKYNTLETQVSINEMGECLVKGPTVMMGYYKNEKATKEVLKNGWFNTQDIVQKDEFGYYKCIGRTKNLIILPNAENICPEDIEQKFYTKYPQIEQVLVYEFNKKINIAFYAPQMSSEQLEMAVKEHNISTPGYAKIAEIVQRHEPMPTTSKGTICKDEVVKAIASEKKSTGATIFSPAEEDVYKKISNLVEIEGIKPDTNIFDYGIDSLSALEIAAELGISVESLYIHPTIKKIAQLVISKNIAETYPNEEYYNNLNNQAPTTRRRTVLITGTTGFLGSYILREISAEPSVRIICLVRSIEKQKRTYRQYFGSDLPKNARPIIGDITDKFLGQGFGEYSSLISEIDEVIHAAADVHHTGDFNRIYKTNVIGTQNIVNFCKSAKAILHHISTYSVSGIGVTKIEPTKKEFSESDFWIGQHYRDNVYVHTKYEAEKVVLKMRAEGFQANIYRAGSIAWDKNGMFQVNAEENGLLGRLKGLIECKTYAGMTKESYFDITPVDDTAKAICTLFFSKNVNMTYHIFNPNLITYQKFADLMNFKVRRTTISEFNKIPNDSKNVRTLKFYTNLSADSASVKLSAEKTSKTLAHYGFKWNDITTEYLSKHIAI